MADAARKHWSPADSGAVGSVYSGPTRMKLYADALPARPIAAPARWPNLRWAADQLLILAAIAAPVGLLVRAIWR
jgi:hypothetical protein